MMTTTDEPRIYVASLSDYNAGVLHGVWIDCDGLDADDIHEAVAAMLAISPTAASEGSTAEEWAIHDYEGFGSLSIGEWESFETIAEYAAAIAEHGAGPVGAYIADAGEWNERKFEDSYAGEWENELAFAYDLADDILNIKDETLAAYFDYEKWSRDLFMGDYWSTDAGAPTYGVYVFRRN